MGEAISDLSSGISTMVMPDSASLKRRRALLRKRQPRMLFSEIGVLRPWSELESELLLQVGATFTYGLEEVVPMTRGRECLVMMLFPAHFCVAEVRTSSLTANPSQGICSSSDSTTDRTHMQSDLSNPMQCNGNEALDETVEKLIAQALKPINTLYYGMQNLENSLSMNQTRYRRVREFYFKDLCGVHTAEDAFVLHLEHRQDGVIDLPLYASPLGKVAREALVAGFRSVLDNNKEKRASWKELRTALLEEQRSQHDAHIPQAAHGLSRSEHGIGAQILHVVEVERRIPPSSKWKTPFLPTDGGLIWRWVDATGGKHPQLVPNLPYKEVVRRRTPPCWPGPLFRATSDWEIIKGSGHDSEGWCYGLVWNSPAWGSEPRFLDALRMRTWRRTFS